MRDQINIEDQWLVARAIECCHRFIDTHAHVNNHVGHNTTANLVTTLLRQKDEPWEKVAVGKALEVTLSAFHG